jgi:hypothetical protein
MNIVAVMQGVFIRIQKRSELKGYQVTAERTKKTVKRVQ